MNCGSGGYGSSNYVIPDASSDAAEELHVVGVYEAVEERGFGEHRGGRVEVIVHPRPKPVALFLSSYEPVLWRITLEPGAQLSRVVTQGYYFQTVEGVPDGVPVHHRSREETCAYAYGWEVAHNGGGGEYPLMIATARDLTGLTETTFQGCYKGDRFEIPYWSGEPPTIRPTPVPGDETIPREDVAFPGCEAVTAEQHYCLTTSYPGQIGLLGLDTGEFCEVATTTAGLGYPQASSIGWLGELMYACTGAGLVRISLRDGSWEAAQVPCDAVSDYRGGLLVSSWLQTFFYWGLAPLHAYPNYAAVLSGEPSDTYWFGLDSTRFTVHGNTFYGAWHATDTINLADLAAGQELDPIHLENYDGWILGMSVTDDGQLVISGDTWGDTVRIFDATSGRWLRELHPATSVFGLSCVVGKANPPTSGSLTPTRGSFTPTAASATATPTSVLATPTPTPMASPASTAAAGTCGDGIPDTGIGEECDDGNNFGGDGCAANCTVESLRPAVLDPARSVAVVQQKVLPVVLTLSGRQAFLTGSPRDTEVRDPLGRVVTRPGEIPVVVKAANVFLEPVRVTGLVCLCVRAVQGSQCGAGNSASGVIGCGPEGLTDIDYKIVQDHNTTPGDPGNGRGPYQLPDDPECDDSFAFPGCGGISKGCREGEACSAAEDFHRPPDYPSAVCNSPQRISFGGGPAGPGSALIHGRMAIGLLRDGGLCVQGLWAHNPDGSCKFPDYGADCEPCTDDDADLGFSTSVVLTTGKAEAALSDANNVAGAAIDERPLGRTCSSSRECSRGESCGRICLESGLGCASDADCGPGDSCDERRCQVLCGGSRCLTTAQGARFDCDALAAHPTGGLSGGALAAAFPSVDARAIGDAVTTLRLAYE